MPLRAAAFQTLERYRGMRRFDETPEPRGGRTRRRKAANGAARYSIQKHDARRLHYDLRLELNGVLKSWAVPKGPSLDPNEKRLAMRTEDHPIEYAEFEGRIPEGNYGAGPVLLWDRGTWAPHGDPCEGLERGKLSFRLSGERLNGDWALVRIDKAAKGRESWLLIKQKDSAAEPGREVVEEAASSIVSGREIEAIADAPKRQPARRDGAGGKRATRRAPLPEFVAPQLATLVDRAPERGDWLFEIKFDGYRALAAVAGDDVRVYTRNRQDWTGRFGRLLPALAALGLDGALLDGEIVALDENGRTDFGRLQEALKHRGPIAYFVFDLLAEKGRSLRGRPLIERKRRLAELLGKRGREGPVYYTDHLAGGGGAMLAALCERGFEGIIAKRADAPYRSARTRGWLKVKCGRNQEFVIVGWSPSTRGRPFSSLLLATRDDDSALRYAGRVGSGFSEAMLADLAAKFRPLARQTPPLAGEIPASVRRQARWLKPALVAEVAFAEFTRDGLVRQARFVGLREDKPAREVRREQPAARPA